MGKTETLGLTLEATDVSQQKVRRVSNIQPDVTIQEVIEPLLAQMNLPQNDPAGQPLVYHALLERQGRYLEASERIGDVVQSGDRLVLEPNISAGTI